MTLQEIRDFPTTIDTGRNGNRFHESLLRSYQLVRKVSELIEAGTPGPVLLEIIEDVMNAPKSSYDGHTPND